jgi:hypothetical protein
MRWKGAPNVSFHRCRAVRQLFKRLGQNDYTLVLDSLAAKCGHSFFGDHTLGGTCMPRSNAGMSACLASRPLSFKINVTGWPRATTAVVEWRDFGHTFDGKPFTNQYIS